MSLTGPLIRGLQEDEARHRLIYYPVFHKSIRKGWFIPRAMDKYVQAFHELEWAHKWRTERIQVLFVLFPTLLPKYDPTFYG